MRRFSELIPFLRRGELDEDFALQLRHLAEKVKLTGKPGTITLTLKVTPNGKNSDEALIYDAVKVAAPQPDNSGCLIFIGQEGELSRTDPSQAPLPEFRNP
jgi:hypothetical protein